MGCTTVSILSPKGGVGRSTLAINLAGGLIESKSRVLIVDADPQGSVMDWELEREHAWDPAPRVLSFPPDATLPDLLEWGIGYDWMVIDTPSGLDRLCLPALKAADMILVPIRPSAADLWATEPLIPLIQTHQRVTRGRKKEVPAVFVVMQQVPGSVLSLEIDEAASSLGLPVLTSRTTQHVGYPQAFQLGLTVQSMAGAGTSSREMGEMIKELSQLLPSNTT